MKHFFIYFSLILIFYIAGLSPAIGTGFDIGIYPTIFQIKADKPSMVEFDVNLENHLNSSTDLNISLKPFTSSSFENGEISYQNVSDLDQFELINKIKIFEGNNPVQKITLAPAQKKQLKVKIEISEAEKNKDYYFSIIFRSDAKEQSENTSSTITGGIASNVLLSVGKTEDPEINIEEFSSPLFLSNGPVPFTVRINNKSNHYASPTGFISFENMFGQVIGKIDLKKVNILANSTRKIPGGDLNDETDSNSITARWNEKFILGYYKAVLDIKTLDNGPSVVKSITFFAFPVKSFSITMLIALIVGFAIYRARKILKSRKQS